MIGLTLSVETFIYVYIFVTIAMIVFNVYIIFQRKGSKILLEKKKLKLLNEIKNNLKLVKKDQQVSEEHIDFLIKKLKRISYFMAFFEITYEYKDQELIHKYLKSIKIVFMTLAQVYKEKNNVQRAYFSYVVTNFNINEKKASNFLYDMMLENIASNSTYLRENSLKALCNFGNPDKIYNALDIMNRNSINHNPKLITDTLITFKGDNELLAKILFTNFKNFTDSYKVAIINYVGFVSSSYKSKFIEILESKDENKEVDLAIIRYFRKYQSIKSEELLLNYLTNFKENEWEYAAVAAIALSNYKSKTVRTALLNALKSSNWYVRANAAESLISLNITNAEVAKIQSSKDKYAIEILEYKLEKRRDINARNIRNS